MSPAGLPVTQAYPEIQAVQVKTTLEGSIFKPVVNRIQRPPDYYAIDRGKQVSGIAPNIIHSLDAAAMMLTVEAATEQGLTHFLMIHDSYGTHAAEASKLSRLLRATFMKMYSGNTVLTNLHSDFTSNIDSECLREGEAMPEMPSVGSLELSQIQDAAYFFA
jgi:DNA-directed RNA polymerase